MKNAQWSKITWEKEEEYGSEKMSNDFEKLS
jgi:hypothetical protein